MARVDVPVEQPRFDSAVVDALIAASAGVTSGRMLALMTDDCVRVADTAFIPPVRQP